MLSKNFQNPIIKTKHEGSIMPESPTLLSGDAYQRVIGLVPHPMLIINLAGEILYANTAISKLLGYSPEELNKMALGQLVPEPSDIFQAFRSNSFQDSDEQFFLGKSDDLKIICSDKTSLYIELSITPFETTDGCFVMASIVDVNDHHTTEIELSRSNQELDQFAYVASHDLKAPLRGIDNLVGWIWEDIDDRESVIEHIQLMRCRIQRMKTLLDDLLEYSRVGRMDDEIDLVDINFLVQDLYQQSSPPEGFTLDQPGKPVEPFETLAAPFGQVIRNLINNAIKHNNAEKGLIRIHAIDKGDVVEIIVEDNGPGIEAKYHDQIFGMFEKLKSKDEVEGSGMGLAMVKKICASVGGSISVASSKGHGSQFCVIWPKKSIIAISK